MKIDAILEDNSARMRALRIQQQLLDSSSFNRGEGLETRLDQDDEWVTLDAAIEVDDQGNYMDLRVMVPVKGGKIHVHGECHATHYDDIVECDDDEVASEVQYHINVARDERQ